MSSVARWTYKEGPVTVWPAASTDRWGQPFYAPPYLIPAIDYMLGGKLQRDDEGELFIPQTVIFFEMAFDDPNVPKRGWKILLGDHLALPSAPPEAEKIRAVTGWPMTKFGVNEIPDWKIAT